jgi:hypothetical protein
MNLEHR